MSNEIYNAFIEAGLSREANRLSETQAVEGRNRVAPAIGHYIAVLDNMLSLESQFPDRQEDPQRAEYFNKSLRCILGYSIPIASLHDNLKSIFSERKDKSRLIRCYFEQESEFAKRLSEDKLRLARGISKKNDNKKRTCKANKGIF